MKIYVVNKELSSAHGTTAVVVLQFQGVMVYMRPVEMNALWDQSFDQVILAGCKTCIKPLPKGDQNKSRSKISRSTSNNFKHSHKHFNLFY